MSSNEFIPSSAPPGAAASPTPVPRFDAEPFRPDGVAPFSGLVLLLAGVALTALALGFVLSFVGQWFYMPIVFPIVAGLVLGGAGRYLVRAGKVRSPAVAGAVAALGGVTMMYFTHYFDLLRLINGVGWQAVTPVVVFKFIDFEATVGVVIGEGGNDGINLGYVGSYIYFAVETVLAACFAYAAITSAAAVPFCRGCNVWKTMRPLAALPHVPPTVAVEALKAGALLDLLSTGTPPGPGLKLKAAVCPRCGGDGSVVAQVDQVTVDSRGRTQVKTLTRYVYPGQVLSLLDQYHPQAPAAAARQE